MFILGSSFFLLTQSPMAPFSVILLWDSLKSQEHGKNENSSLYLFRELPSTFFMTKPWISTGDTVYVVSEENFSGSAAQSLTNLIP